MLTAVNRYADLALGVHYIDVGDLHPAVQLRGLSVALGRIASALIGCVAFNYRSADMLDGGLHELRAQEILVPRLAAVQLHGDAAAQLKAEGLICPDHVIGAYLLYKIYL